MYSLRCTDRVSTSTPAVTSSFCRVILPAQRSNVTTLRSNPLFRTASMNFLISSNSTFLSDFGVHHWTKSNVTIGAIVSNGVPSDNLVQPDTCDMATAARSFCSARSTCM